MYVKKDHLHIDSSPSDITVLDINKGVVLLEDTLIPPDTAGQNYKYEQFPSNTISYAYARFEGIEFT